MKNGIDKFLTSDKVLYSLPWIYTVSTIAYEIICFIYYKSMSGIFTLGIEIMNILLVFGIAISYKVHEKNIMKSLFGAIMMERVIASFNLLTSHFSYEGYTFIKVETVITLLLYILLLVNHLILGYGHKANPSRVSLNRTVGFLLIVMSIINGVYEMSWYIANPEYLDSIMPIIISLLVIISDAAIVLEILCIETKVDAYKIIRENK